MRKQGKRAGFTLAEMCVVVAITAIVGGILVAAGVHARSSNDVRAARAQVVVLVDAISSYEAKRGETPNDVDGDGLTTTEEVVEQLKNWNVLAEDFEPYDPWGQKYVIVLQRDYDYSPDTKRDINFFPVNDFPGGYQVYSGGPDCDASPYTTDEAAADDISNLERS